MTLAGQTLLSPEVTEGRKLAVPKITKEMLRTPTLNVGWNVTPATEPNQNDGPSTHAVIIGLAVVLAVGLVGGLNWYQDTRRRDVADTRLRSEIAEALKRAEAGSRDQLKALIRNRRTASRATTLLGELGWQPAESDEIVYINIARQDGAALRANWTTTKDVLFKDLYYSTVGPDDGRTENAIYALIGIGNSEALDQLERRLLSSGDKQLAELYLNSGQQRLSGAASVWARRNGYNTEPYGKAAMQWGEFR